MATIETDDETYIFEPAWRHQRYAMTNATLAYRVSDIRDGDDGSDGVMCGFVDSTSSSSTNSTYQQSIRFRRDVSDETVTKNRCSLKIVADYHFYETIGNRSTAFSARYLVSVNLLYHFFFFRLT